MRVDAVVFDCDGVLIDSEVVVGRIAAEELTQLGYRITPEEVVSRFAGRPAREMQAELEAQWERPIPRNYAEQVNKRTFDAYGKELKIIPGVAEALDEIRLPICVASSGFPEKLMCGLQTVGLAKRFQSNIISATLVAQGKPQPDNRQRS